MSSQCSLIQSWYRNRRFDHPGQYFAARMAHAVRLIESSLYSLPWLVPFGDPINEPAFGNAGIKRGRSVDQITTIFSPCDAREKPPF